MDTLDCARVEERLPELLEGALDGDARAEVERHLAACPRCAELLSALTEVVAALRDAPELDPARDLAERAATAALRAGPQAPPAPATRLVPFPRLAAATQGMFRSSVPLAVRGLAAALALAITGGVLLAQSFVGSPVRAADRVVERTVNAGAYLAERKDRLVEDFRILRVVIGTAFEGRLDRVNDRVDDYRRLLERRRVTPVPQAPTPDARVPEAPGGTVAQFLNFAGCLPVEPYMTREARTRIGRPVTRTRSRRIA